MSAWEQGFAIERLPNAKLCAQWGCANSGHAGGRAPCSRSRRRSMPAAPPPAATAEGARAIR
eukprot:6162282-Prymnesium_polylepis.1